MNPIKTKPATFGSSAPLSARATVGEIAVALTLALGLSWSHPDAASAQRQQPNPRSTPNPVAGPNASGDWTETAIPGRARVHDFGIVPRGGVRSHAFTIANPFPEPIGIAELRASCGCTAARATAGAVPPGGSAVIEATMDTAKFAGRKEVAITVKLFRQGRPVEVRLTLAADIQDNLRMSPGLADLGAMTREQPTRSILIVEHKGNPSWEIERMISGNPHLDAEMTEIAREGDRVRYQLTTWLKGAVPSGPIRDEIRCFTNDPRQPEFPIMVTGFVLEPLRISPERLDAGIVPNDRVTRTKFAIRADEPFQITKVEGMGDGFVWEPGDSAPKTAHLIQIAFDPNQSRLVGQTKRTFRIHTNLKGARSIAEATVVLRLQPRQVASVK